MKFRLLYFVPLCLLCSLFLLSNKNGRATTGFGNTGAPGDQTNSNGTAKTCGASDCHNSSGATVVITVLDSSNNMVTQYIPGKQYTAQVVINATVMLGYGFQMVALKDAGNTDLNGFTDVGTNNYKLATANGRRYAEHSNVSTSNVFNVTWTAPVAGTGDVTIYAAGNGVNKNNNSSGDQAGLATPLHLTEVTTAAPTPGDPVICSIHAVATPFASDLLLNADIIKNGAYRLYAFDMTGRVVWNLERQFAQGAHQLTIPAADWPSGIYYLGLAGAGQKASVKVLKL